MQTFRLKSLSFFIVAMLIIAPIASVPVTSALAQMPLTSSVPAHIGELLQNGTFDSGAASPWFANGVSIAVNGGILNATISNAGTNIWDNVVKQTAIPVFDTTGIAGLQYQLTVRAWVPSGSMDITAVLEQNGAPYTHYYTSPPLNLTITPQTFTFNFDSDTDDPAAVLQFWMGAQGNNTVYLDNISLNGPNLIPGTAFLSALRTNQKGYLPNASKIATLATDVTTPLAWTLYNNAHSPVASGMSTVFGADAASGENVHTIDFSYFNTIGSGYTLEANGQTSHPFDIRPDIYYKLKYDALAYFYQTRAGIPIEMPYARRTDLARPAGHDSNSPNPTSTSISPSSTSVVSPTPSITPSPTNMGASPNKGDKQVQCFIGNDKNNLGWTGNCTKITGSTPAPYKLDVPKGWYDAGDYGKYVPSGAIAAWTLLNQYERAKYLGGNLSAFADGKMNIPENANGVPDILDEARWEIEFMLSMQVPDGGVVEHVGPNGIVESVEMGGMVHHKLHGAAATAFGVSPDQDPQMRYLYPPSTAATLNLAAVAAQCARIWREFNQDGFADTCLKAAKAAWAAAIAQCH